jgi:hypothetical protein
VSFLNQNSDFDASIGVTFSFLFYRQHNEVCFQIPFHAPEAWLDMSAEGKTPLHHLCIMSFRQENSICNDELKAERLRDSG